MLFEYFYFNSQYARGSEYASRNQCSGIAELRRDEYIKTNARKLLAPCGKLRRAL